MASVVSARPPGAVPAGRGAASRLPDLISVLLLLAVLAPAGIIFSRLEFWHRFVPPWPAFLAGALCCGLASLSRRPIWWLVATYVAGLLATTIALYHTLPGPALALRDEQLRAHLRLWFEQLRGGEQVYDDVAVVMWSWLAAWAAGMWASWAALRAGWHWLVLAATGAVLVSSIGHLPNWPAPGLAVFIFAALLFLAWTNYRQLALRAGVRGLTHYGGGSRTWIWYLGAVGAGALALVAVGWLTPAVHWRTSFYRAPSGSLTAGGLQFFRESKAKTTLHDFGSSMTFGGAISLGDAPVASVEAADRGYLYGVSYDRYTGSGWITTAVDQPRGQASSRDASAAGDTARGRLELRANGESSYRDSEAVDLTIHAQQPSAVLLSAGPPVGLTGAIGVENGVRDPGSGATASILSKALRGTPANELTELRSSRPIPSGSIYTTSGLISRAAPDSLRGAGTQMPDWVQSDYLQLPRELPDRVRKLAADLTKASTTNYDRALAIQTYLRRMPYDQNIPAPPGDEDGVDYLLFVTGRGYCDYFASGMAVMLRSLGVPARVVTGYVMHEPDGGRYQVREHDAHAWTEVFFPGYGWQRFDPTPGGAGSYLSGPENNTATRPNLSAQGTAPAATPATSDNATAPSARRVTPAGRYAAGAGWWPFFWLGTLLFCVLLALYIWLRRQRDGRRAVISAWRWTAFAGRVVVRRQARHETATEYAATLSRGSRSSSMRELAASYGRARFGGPRSEMPRPAESWRRFGGSLVALAGRTFRRDRE